MHDVERYLGIQKSTRIALFLYFGCRASEDLGFPIVDMTGLKWSVDSDWIEHTISTENSRLSFNSLGDGYSYTEAPYRLVALREGFAGLPFYAVLSTGELVD